MSLSKKHIFKTTLQSAVATDSQTTIPLTSAPAEILTAAYLPNYITISDGTKWEAIKFTGYSAPNLTGCTRGVDGTTPQTWDSGSAVFFAPVPSDIDEINNTLSGFQAQIDALVVGTFSDLSVEEDSGLDVNIATGKFLNEDGVLITYAGASAYSLTDDATNYVELDYEGTLSHNTTGFTVGQVPLGTVTTSSGAITEILDKRSIVSGGKNDGYNELTYSATTNIDFSTGTSFYITLTGGVTFTFSNPRNGMVKRLRIIQDGDGSRTVAFPANMTYPDGTAITFSTTADAIDEVVITYNGTAYTIYELGLNIKVPA
jgi:hypothetical protein